MLVVPTLIERLLAAEKVVVLTGSGISAASGVPTFRDAQSGVWSRFRPEDLATPDAFKTNPGRVWRWYQWRRELVGQAEPNPAHFAVRDLEEHFTSFTLITQNVDGLHQRAGSRDVIEFHGNIMRNKCFDEERILDAVEEPDAAPPRCPHCGGPVRPDVVWFGERIPALTLEAAFEEAAGCDVFFCIGTSALVHPAANLAAVAHNAGAMLVEINPDRTPLSDVADFSLKAPAGEALPQLVAELRQSAAAAALKEA